MSKLWGSIRVFDNINVSILTEILGTSFFFLIIFAGAVFSNIPEKYENIVFTIKNPRNRNKWFQK